MWRWYSLRLWWHKATHRGCDPWESKRTYLECASRGHAEFAPLDPECAHWTCLCGELQR